MSRGFLPKATALGLAGLFLTLSCGRDATAPSDPGPISLLVVSAAGQPGVVGTELPQAVVIKPLMEVPNVYRRLSPGGLR